MSGVSLRRFLSYVLITNYSCFDALQDSNIDHTFKYKLIHVGSEDTYLTVPFRTEFPKESLNKVTNNVIKTLCDDGYYKWHDKKCGTLILYPRRVNNKGFMFLLSGNNVYLLYVVENVSSASSSTQKIYLTHSTDLFMTKSSFIKSFITRYVLPLVTSLMQVCIEGKGSNFVLKLTYNSKYMLPKDTKDKLSIIDNVINEVIKDNTN